MRYFLIVQLLFCSLFSWAQKTGVPKYREIIVVIPSGTMKFQVKVKKQKVRTRLQYIYTWYNNDKIQNTQGAYDGMLLDGFYKEYDTANRLMAAGNFKSGLKCGEWKSWHTNGRLKEVSYWCKGRPCGSVKGYDDDGSIVSHYRYCGEKKIDVIATDLNREQKRQECKAKCVEKKALRKKASDEKQKARAAAKELKKKTAAPKTEISPKK